MLLTVVRIYHSEAELRSAVGIAGDVGLQTRSSQRQIDPAGCLSGRAAIDRGRVETRRDGVVARTPGVISTDLVRANCGLSFDLGVHERNQLLRSEDVQRSL